MKRTITPTEVLPSTVTIPASKSHTIRALLVAAMAEGTSTIVRPLVSEDTLSCLGAVSALGAGVERKSGKEETWTVQGTVGNVSGSDRSKNITIDVGNSGTTLYLAAGLAALGRAEVTFTGDVQIRSRPVGNLLASLRDLGASVKYLGNEGYPPFTIKGPLKGGKTSIDCPTSQYLSSLLLAAPLADGNTDIDVITLREQPYVEMTLGWIDEQFVTYENRDFKHFFIPGGQRFRAFNREIPGDFSSAAFFLCAAAIMKKTITLKGLDMTDSQGDKAVVHMLEKMGCKMETGKNFVRIHGGPLRGGEFDLNNTPDALPALAVTACFAAGETRLVNVPQARLKETDRIAVMKMELAKMGAQVEELPDGLVIRGKLPGKAPLKGTNVSGHGDHRVIMALSIAALGADGDTTIDDDSAVAITFPHFFEILFSRQQPDMLQ